MQEMSLLNFNKVAKHRMLDWSPTERNECLAWLQEVTNKKPKDIDSGLYSEKQVGKIIERLYKVYVIRKKPNHKFTPRQEERFCKWLERISEGHYGY